MALPKEYQNDELARRFDIEIKATTAIARQEYLVKKGMEPEPYDELLKSIAESGEISTEEIPAILKRIQELEAEKN